MTQRTVMDSPIGPLSLEGDDEALTLIELPRTARRRHPRSGRVALAKPLAAAVEQLEQYFAGERQEFDVPLALAGTAFQCAVWRTLATIEYGETISYGELAARVGRPRAYRAVGQANGANPIPIILPCHRVLASGGRIGGYGGGLVMKRRLLALEGVEGV